MPQVGHPAFEPATDRLRVDLQAGGDILFGEPRLEERTAQGLVQAGASPKHEDTPDSNSRRP